MTERLVRPAELARFWHVDPKTVRAWILEGRLAALRTPGRQYRLLSADVLAFCAREKLEPPPFVVPTARRMHVVGLGDAQRRALKRLARGLTVTMFDEVHAGLFATVLDPPDLLVLDVGLSGYVPEAALKALRDTRPTAKLCIVAANVPSAARAKALTDAGATHVVTRARSEELAGVVGALATPG